MLFVGSIFNRRHVPELIEGFTRLARARRTFVSTSSATIGPCLMSISRQLFMPAASTIGFTFGRDVSDQELQALYATSAAFVFLSDAKGSG